MWLLESLAEARGKPALYEAQSPQELKALKEHALIEGAISSNRIEGIEIDRARIGTIVFGKSPLRDRNEEEVRGYYEKLDFHFSGYYSNYMKTLQLKVSRIGNSRGVRLPAASLRRYRIGAAVLMEEWSDGIFLRPVGPVVEKLSWADTAREMAAGREDWSEWDVANADGLASTPWGTGKAGRKAEKRDRYRSVLQSAKKS